MHSCLACFALHVLNMRHACAPSFVQDNGLKDVSWSVRNPDPGDVLKRLLLKCKWCGCML